MTIAGMHASGILDLLVVSAEYVLVSAENASALAILVVMATLLGRRWIAPRFRYLMWLLVAVRLAVPVAPASPFSLQRLWLPGDASHDAETRAAGTHLVWQATPSADSHPAAQYHAIENGQAHAVAASDYAAQIVLLIWVSGGVVCALILCASTVRFRRRIRCYAVTGARQRCEVLDECRQLVGLARRVRLLEVPGLRSPAQMGLFRPTVLLPSDLAELFSDAQLRHVFLHELTHVKRWDVAVNGLLALLRILHWWNPLYWLVQSRVTVERELACDARVLRCFANGEARAYGSTMLDVVSRLRSARNRGLRLPTAALGLVPFLNGKSSLRRRIRLLSCAELGESIGQRFTAVVLTLVLLVVGNTDYRGSVAVAEDRAFRFPTETTWSLAPPVIPSEDEVLLTRVYVVEDLLESLTDEFGLSLEGAMALLELPIESSCGPRLVTHGSDLAGNETPEVRPFFAWHEEETVIVRASQAQHKSIVRQLAIWRRHGPQQITLDVRLISTPEEKPLPVGGGGRIISPRPVSRVVGSRRNATATNVDAGGLITSERRIPVYLQTVSSSIRDQIIDAAQADAASNIMLAPKVTLFNGQQATVSSVVQRPFVTGLDDSSGSPEPQIEVVEDGFKLEVTAVCDGTTGSIDLDCRLSLSEITDVTTASVSRGAGSEPLAVQIPQVELQQYSATGELADSDSLLLSPLHVDNSGTRLYVVVTAKRVD